MTGRASAIARALAAVLIVIVYAVLAHTFSTTSHVAIALLPLALAPLFIALLLRLSRSGKWLLLAVITAIALTLSFPNSRDFFSHNLAWVYFAQDSALNLMLGFLFGRTLIKGRIPLCSLIAASLQRDPTAHLLQYTRRVTIAWTIFFASMVIVSTLLFFSADRVIWSSFANLWYWPLLISMFALEYCARLLILPRAERAGFFATINGFRDAVAAKSSSDGINL
ncbi:MAG: hypothetical protein JWM78_401 [Verrucomicrobiaceae bacterium]|nr:hypothetical protein [Verrucomicrobiaceae bacterium]